MSKKGGINDLSPDLIEIASRFSTERMSSDLCFKYFLFLDEIAHDAYFESCQELESYLLEKSGKFVGTKQELIESNGGTTAGIISFTRDVNLESKDHKQYQAKVEFCFTESALNPKSKDVYLGDVILI